MLKISGGSILTHSWEDKGIHAFTNHICLKVNVINEFKLAYYNFTIQNVYYYAIAISPLKIWIVMTIIKHLQMNLQDFE